MFKKCVSFIIFFLLYKFNQGQDESNSEDASNWTKRFNKTINKIGAISTISFTVDISKDDLQFLLYDSTKETTAIDFENPLEFLNPSNPTKIIIHGWKDNGKKKWVQEMAFYYNQKGSYNVIAVDWSKISTKNYFYVCAAAQFIGFIVGDFVVKISQEVDSFLENVHVVGHSMGAQISGFAGKRVQSEIGKSIDRITGLDPAMPGFVTPLVRPKKLRLSETDASFIDIIHTSVASSAYSMTLGTVDFYVNVGKTQLSCKKKLPNIKNEGNVLYYFI